MNSSPLLSRSASILSLLSILFTLSLLCWLLNSLSWHLCEENLLFPAVADYSIVLYARIWALIFLPLLSRAVSRPFLGEIFPSLLLLNIFAWLDFLAMILIPQPCLIEKAVDHGAAFYKDYFCFLLLLTTQSCVMQEYEHWSSYLYFPELSSSLTLPLRQICSVEFAWLPVFDTKRYRWAGFLSSDR